jgi:hypothetical protein
MRRHERPTLGGERGQGLVEFALVLPLLIILIFGMIDVGKAISYWNDETHLANEAARYAAVNNCSPCGADSINNWIRTQAGTDELKNGGGSIAGPGMNVNICLPTNSGAAGEPVQVTITATYKWLDYLAGKFGSIGTTLRGKATMRIEKPYDTAPGAPNKYTISSCP